MSVPTLLRRELRDAVRRYWFLVNATLFATAGVLIMAFGQPDAMILGARGHARSLAGLMQLAMVFVPLMAIVPSVVAIAGERESGTLSYLLAQPVTRTEVYLGKWVGISSATALSVLVGFGFVGMVAAARGAPSVSVAALLASTMLLAITFVSIGLWISARTPSRSKATSLGMTVWMLLAGLGSLGVMTAFVQWGLPAWSLQAWSILNPIEAYRLAGVVLLDPETTALGPVGAALLGRMGAGGVIGWSVVSLISWAGIAFGFGLRSFAAADMKARGAGR